MDSKPRVYEEAPVPVLDAEQPDPAPEDTSTTRGELLERKYGVQTDIVDDERPAKRLRADDNVQNTSDSSQQYQKGVAPIKAE